MRQNQNGFSHVILIALIALVVGVTGLVGYKVSSSNEKPSTASVTTNQRQQKQTTTKEVAVQSEKPVQPETAPSSSPTKPATAPPKPAPQSQSYAQAPAPQKRVIAFTKGGGGQQDSIVRVSANLSETQQGTCTYRFSLNGTVRVERTSNVTNSNQCFLDIPVSAFPKSAFYSFSLSFVSSDGLVSATQSPYDIEVK